MLEGEWLVQFHAPWCPACNALKPAWKELSSRTANSDVKFKTGSVDVTESPGLSGRFMVTALPTIFHVRNAEFRQYRGPRDADFMFNFVQHGLWKQVDPVSSWKAPHSAQMTLVAEFFKLSQVLRSVHTTLMEQYGLPTWGSYLIFAIATIFIGALLGLVLVCIIDLLYPPRRHDKQLVTQAEIDKARGGKSSDDEELINDDIVDDKEENSDAERNSPPDTSEDDEAKKASESDAAGDSAGEPAKQGKQEVRKRRARKAD
ncbi:thioredoxin domain-containing protein [Phthorimaea operculella]|nr:thioredoxin domain-containing protein [Phthorimaea operculella]